MGKVLTRILQVGVAACAATGILATSGGAMLPAGQGDVTIRHAPVGCHVLASSGSPLTTQMLVVLRAGQALTVTNRDNCGHDLIQVGGPTAIANDRALPPLGGATRVSLDRPGRYVFETAEDESTDLVETTEARGFGLAAATSTGADNTLRIVVRVLPDRNHSGE